MLFTFCGRFVNETESLFVRLIHGSCCCYDVCDPDILGEFLQLFSQKWLTERKCNKERNSQNTISGTLKENVEKFFNEG